MPIALPLVISLLLMAAPPEGGAADSAGWDPALLTVAERSDFRATATHEQVMAMLAAIHERSDLTTLTEFGRSVEDRPLPLLIIADPPVATAGEARLLNRTIVFAFGNIHAGEVCGKEALLMLARELALTPEHPLLNHLIILLAPIYNADGNERMSPDNRPGQVGPVEGMGTRENAQGLDLNRDWIKLEAPESRAMVRLLAEWDPHVSIDTHTTNGSPHRYVLTYDGPLNPSGFRPSIEFVRNEMLPTVSERLRDRTAYDTFFYGNFNDEHTVWETYSALPRYGSSYQGLRGQMSVLSEAYAYAPYRDRVLATLEFVREVMTFTAEHGDRIHNLHAAAQVEVTEAGRRLEPQDTIGIRHRLSAFPEPVVIRGYEAAQPHDDEEGRAARDYTVVHAGRFEATRSVRRPFAYIIEGGSDDVTEKLRQHGIEMEPFSGAAMAESYIVREIDRRGRAFQGHRLVRLEADAVRGRRAFADGAILVRLAQPLGNLIVYLLEPESEDGLATWGFFDDALSIGEEFPVHRVQFHEDVEEGIHH